MKQTNSYSYEITVAATTRDFNASSTRPIAARVFVRHALSQWLALQEFREVHFPVLRRNGIVRSLNQALASLTIRRIATHRMTH